MKSKIITRCLTSVPVVAAFWVAVSAPALGQTATSLALAENIVQFSGAPGGVCAVVGRTDTDLALALAQLGSFQVHCLYADATLCGTMRQALRATGMCGVVAADTLTGGRLPYTDNLVNIAVVDAYPALRRQGLSPGEILRILAPLGTAYIGSSAASDASGTWVDTLTAELKQAGVQQLSVAKTGGTWVCISKPWPPDIDEWTHYLHGADGNPVARDRVVAPPEHYQWISGPMWLRSHETDTSISTMVTARGRLFYIIDEAPISLAGQHELPDKWALLARDAFNGVVLWRVPIRRWGWREWKPSWFSTRPGDFPLNIRRRLVAAADKLYVTLGYRAPVSELDARTGEVLQTYAGTERTGEILYLNGTLVLAIVEDGGGRVMAVDAASGKQLWRSEAVYGGTTVDYLKWTAMHGRTDPPKIDATLNIATDGKVVALIDGTEIACLDCRTGAEKWRTDFPEAEADRAAGGAQAQDRLWTGTMIVSDGVVVHASPNKLAGFATDTGALLWEQPKRYIGHLWYEWKDVFVINGLVWTWSAEMGEGSFDIGRKRKQRTLHPESANGYDIKTGELKKQIDLGTIFNTNHHHRCYRNKATVRYILASRRGTEFVDLEQGKHTVHNWVRGACHMGMMPANGLQYAPPHPCACYIDEKLSGMNVLAPARADRVAPAVGERLIRGPAFGTALNTPASGEASAKTENGTLSPAEQWPAFRCDSMRTGSVNTRIPDDATALWRRQVGGKLSPPIIVGDRLFAALTDAHQVICLDVATGATVWEFATGARVDSPPTYHNGTILFGSADGWVYCVRAGDGQLAWRYFAAPEQRLIGAFGQLESAWPVHGSVLVQNDTAYVAAGRSSQLDGGIRIYALDPATGALRQQTTLEGPDYAAGDFEENFRLPMGALSDVMMGDGERLYMRAVTLDGELKPQTGRPALSARYGLLDDSYFKRTPWTFRAAKASDYARLIVHDKRSVYYVRMFDSLRGLDPTVFFTPGQKGYLLFAKNMVSEPQDAEKRGTWSKRIPVRIRAMVLTPERLYVAGPPDVVDPGDPLGAFENRKGATLHVIDAASGDEVAVHKLAFPPVFNGAAAASGRLYLVEEDGSISCFGK